MVARLPFPKVLMIVVLSMANAYPYGGFPCWVTSVLLSFVVIDDGQRRSFPLLHNWSQMFLPSLEEPSHGGDPL